MWYLLRLIMSPSSLLDYATAKYSSIYKLVPMTTARIELTPVVCMFSSHLISYSSGTIVGTMCNLFSVWSKRLKNFMIKRCNIACFIYLSNYACVWLLRFVMMAQDVGSRRPLSLTTQWCGLLNMGIQKLWHCWSPSKLMSIGQTVG